MSVLGEAIDSGQRFERYLPEMEKDQVGELATTLYVHEVHTRLYKSTVVVTEYGKREN